MDPIAPLLALASAASWGASDFAGGITTRLSSTLLSVLLTQTTGLLISIGLLALSGETMPGPEAMAWSLAAGACGTFGLFAFYLALSRGTMGLVAPLTALIAATLPALVGIAAGDVLGPLVVVGIGAALVAVVLIAMPIESPGTPRLPTFHGSRAREWLLIVIGGLGFASFFLCIDVAHEAGGDVWWPLAMVKLAGFAIALAAVLIVAALGRAPARRLGRAALLMGVLTGIGDLAGNLFLVLANQVGELSTVVVVSSLYPVVTALLARMLLHERLGPLRTAGVALAVSGVVLIGLGSL